MSRRNISANPIQVHNTIATRKHPRPKSAKPVGPQNEIPVPKRTYIKDPTYMKNGIELVEVVGKLAPIRFVVKKTKSRRRRPRRKLPAFSDATMAYVRRVRETFWNRQEVYHEFVAIMGEMNSVEKGSRMVELIERVVLLFDGYPELIFSFDAFLPDRYELDLQDDAVVVKVYEDWEALEDGDEDDYVEVVDGDTERPDTARGRTRKANIDETVEYVKGIKKIFSYRPEIYREFSLLLQAYHMGTSDELHTIRSIVRLFQGYPNLVLGFNEFLPKGCAIHMYDTRKYTIEYRDKQGTACTTTIDT